MRGLGWNKFLTPALIVLLLITVSFPQPAYAAKVMKTVARITAVIVTAVVVTIVTGSPGAGVLAAQGAACLLGVGGYCRGDGGGNSNPFPPDCETRGDCPLPPPEPIDGVCGPSPSNPVHYECSSGDLGPTEERADEYRWWCLGSNGGRDAFCAEEKLRFDTNPPHRGVCIGGDCPGGSAPGDGSNGGAGGGNNGGGLFDWLTPLNPFTPPPSSFRNACTNDGACVRVRGSGPNQCSDPGNPDSSNCAQPAPTCSSFISSPQKLVYPPAKSATLSWNCAKAHNGCSISPGSLIEGGGQNLPQSGSVNTLPLSQTTEFVLTCRGRGGASPEYRLPLGTLRVYQLGGGKIREVAP